MKYVVKIYLNGIYWDDTYPTDREEAEKWKMEIEDASHSIWDRVNGDALMQFIQEYNISNEDNIKVTAKVGEDYGGTIYEQKESNYLYHLICNGINRYHGWFAHD